MESTCERTFHWVIVFSQDSNGNFRTYANVFYSVTICELNLHQSKLFQAKHGEIFVKDEKVQTVWEDFKQGIDFVVYNERSWRHGKHGGLSVFK